ncbi:MAG: putative DNA-binding protein (MmcQ/YjbR family) [Pseudohongiellaceae bacterium]|jgi:predicted DNA-binding protein (MmcQ/YjbR family)
MPSPVHPQLSALRQLTASWPETSEVETWDHPTFRAGQKIFATYAYHKGLHSISCKQSKPDQALLVTDPRFQVASHVGRHGWITIDIDHVEWDTVAELVEQSYRLIALKRMVKALDESQGA